MPRVARQRINHDGNMRMAVRRTRMLGNGCEETLLIDGSLPQMLMDKEEIRGRVNVLERDLTNLKMALPCAERHGVAPSALSGPHESLSLPQGQNACRSSIHTRNASGCRHQRMPRGMLPHLGLTIGTEEGGQ
jgi:hypothetical protein